MLDPNAQMASILSAEENEAVTMAQPQPGYEYDQYYTSGMWNSTANIWGAWVWTGNFDNTPITYSNWNPSDPGTNAYQSYIVFNQGNFQTYNRGTWTGVQGGDAGPYLPGVCEIRCGMVGK